MTPFNSFADSRAPFAAALAGVLNRDFQFLCGFEKRVRGHQAGDKEDDLSIPLRIRGGAGIGEHTFYISRLSIPLRIRGLVKGFKHHILDSPLSIPLRIRGCSHDSARH